LYLVSGGGLTTSITYREIIKNIMKLELQVTSRELSEKLRDLGVKQESLFYYHIDTLGDYQPTLHYNSRVENGYNWFSISAFTVAELEVKLMRVTGRAKGGVMSLSFENSQCNDKDCDCGGVENYRAILRLNGATHHVEMEAPSKGYIPTSANVKAKMLIYLLENKLITL
jgi:hypothetical protein